MHASVKKTEFELQVPSDMPYARMWEQLRGVDTFFPHLDGIEVPETTTDEATVRRSEGATNKRL